MAVSACPHGRRRVGRVSGAATACRLVVSDWRASAGRTSWGSPRAAVVAKAVESPYSGRVTALIGLRDNLAMARLHLITDLRGGVEPFVEFLDQMFNAGVDLVQVRDTGDRATERLAAILEIDLKELNSRKRFGALSRRFDAMQPPIATVQEILPLFGNL